MAKILLTISSIILSLILVIESKKTIINVVTVNSPPFVYEFKNNGTLKGFAIELLTEIFDILGHSWQQTNIYISPDGRYGTRVHGKWNGMIGEVVEQRADLAIADLTITKEREEAVAFTVPILYTGISALMKKSTAEKIKSWSDIANQKKIMYGTIKGGSTHSFFKTSQNPIVKKMYTQMSKNRRSYSRNHAEAINRIENDDYILFGESLTFKYITGRKCDLTLLDDQYLQERSFGIAFAKDSPYKSLFDDAIIYFKTNGKIENLKQKYWKSYCV